MVEAFGVETIELDLPPLVGALSRRLHEVGVPMTPARSAELARALALVRPVGRRRLYWTTRAVLVTDPAQVPALDQVFFSIFGGEMHETFEPEEMRSAATPPDDRPTSSRTASLGDSASVASSPPGADENGAEVDVPLALASDEEVLRRKSFDALEPFELVELYRLMSRLDLATPLRQTRRYARGRHGARVDMRRTLRASLRTGGDPIRLARRRRRSDPRRLVLLCD